MKTKTTKHLIEAALESIKELEDSEREQIAVAAAADGAGRPEAIVAAIETVARDE